MAGNECAQVNDGFAERAQTLSRLYSGIAFREKWSYAKVEARGFGFDWFGSLNHNAEHQQDKQHDGLRKRGFAAKKTRDFR
jgi:hypothetical protein